jgi:hypothetical protein
MCDVIIERVYYDLTKADAFSEKTEETTKITHCQWDIVPRNNSSWIKRIAIYVNASLQMVTGEFVWQS